MSMMLMLMTLMMMMMQVVVVATMQQRPCAAPALHARASRTRPCVCVRLRPPPTRSSASTVCSLLTLLVASELESELEALRAPLTEGVAADRCPHDESRSTLGDRNQPQDQIVAAVETRNSALTVSFFSFLLSRLSIPGRGVASPS
jgi:hypothetical protein